MCNHYRNQDTELFHHHKDNPHLPHLWPLETMNLFFISTIVSFQECYINVIIQYVTFWDCFLFSIISMISIQILVSINSFLLFYCIVVHGMEVHSLQNHLSIEQHFGHLHFLHFLFVLLFMFLFHVFLLVTWTYFLNFSFIYLQVF